MPGSGRPLMARRPSGPARAGLSGSIAALAIVVLVGVLAIPVSSLVRNGKSFWPEHWDPRLAPIAHRDEQIHALKYKHPVPVRFLSDAAFKKLVVGSDSSDTAGRAEIGREAATFRALGFIGGKVDLFQVTKQADEAGVLAFYDFDKKEIVVRGTALDVSRRATLAHELTHVLQDQHFDIRKIEARAAADDEQRGGSAGAVLALIEGDANRVRDSYLKGLTPAERAAYDRAQRRQGSDIANATPDVPPIVQLLFSAPYELGPLTIRMLLANGGNAAVDAALTGPTPTSADFVQAGLVAPPPPGLPAPILGTNEKAEGSPESFGAFELYVMLASRDDPATALMAADSVLGGRAQGLRRNGKYCYRATLAIRDAAAAKFVVGSVQRWARSATDALVSRDGSHVTFTACDPGVKAVGASKARLDAAELLLGGRSGIAVGAAEGGVPAGAARCVARLFALSPGAISTLEQAARATLPPAAATRLRDLVRQEALTCRDNPKAGLL
jgi:hypothetical protein